MQRPLFVFKVSEKNQRQGGEATLMLNCNESKDDWKSRGTSQIGLRATSNADKQKVRARGRSLPRSGSYTKSTLLMHEKPAATPPSSTPTIFVRSRCPHSSLWYVLAPSPTKAE